MYVKGGTPPDLFAYRKHVTQKYGLYSFFIAVGVMAVVVLGNTVISTKLFVVVNERPTKIRKIILQWPWMKIVLWVFGLLTSCCCLLETNNFDLVFIAKRLGRVSVALMPPMYFATLYPSPLPRSFYLQLLPIHKFMSRIIVLLATLHGALYTYIYYSHNFLIKLQKWPNILGILAWVVFLIMAITSIYQMRRRAFELFYQIHIMGSWFVLPILKWHSRPRCDYYLDACLAVLVYQLIMKYKLSLQTKLRVQSITPSLLLVVIPRDTLPPSMWNWPVASHVRISGSMKNPLNWIRSSHPYTIASLPDDGDMRIVVRPGDYKIKLREVYTVFGPHACIPNYFMNQIHLSMTTRVLIVVGGTGVSFGAPLMRYLKLNGTDVKMVWAIRDPMDTKVLPQLGLHREALEGKIEIYYTGTSYNNDDDLGDDIEIHEEELTINASNNCCNNDSLEVDTSIPRRIREDVVLSQYSKFLNNARPHLNLRLKSWLYGYSIDDDDCCCADRIVDSCLEDRLGAWVVSCGNKNLTSVCKTWAEQAGVGYFQDSFTL